MDLRQYITDNNISVSDLSRKAGLPYSTVSEIVNGRKEIGKCSANTVYRIALSLGSTVEDLLLSDNGGLYADRYSLDRKQSLFLAKKLWDENVYCGMKMEDRNVTFPQTKTILEGVNVPDVALEDVMAIINMRDAWRFMLGTLDQRLDLDYICKLNSFIARDEALQWGVLRTGTVGISGSDYKPPVPDAQTVSEDLNRIISSYCTVTEKALELFCYITYSQLFWDGNKRTALASANKLLVSSGKGLMTVKEKDMGEFNELLRRMYDTGDRSGIKDFLYGKAIRGIDYE